MSDQQSPRRPRSTSWDDYSNSPGKAQRLTPPASASAQPQSMRNLSGERPLGSPGSAQRLSPLATSGRPVSRNLFGAQPSMSPDRPPPPSQPSSSRSYLSMARNLFGYSGSQSQEQSQGPSRSPTQGVGSPQRERSVRPKLRVPGRPTGMSSSPSPEIVRMFRRPDTGSPDFDKMRQMSKPTMDSSKMAGYDLASRSQIEMARIYGRYGPADRKEKVFKEKDWMYDHLGKRWIKRNWRGPSETGVERRPLIPRSRSERDLYDDRFQQSLDTMGERRVSRIMPTGRLGFGPIPQRPRSQSMSDLHSLRVPGVNEDPSMWSNKEQGFAQRLRGLSKDDLKRYRTYRWYADADRYPGVSKRMVPPPTGTNLMDENKRRVNQYIRRSASAPGRMERRSRVREHSILPSTIFPESASNQYPSIPERREKRRLDQMPGQQMGEQQTGKRPRPPQSRQRSPQPQPQPLPILQPLKEPTAPSDLRERRQRRWSFDSGQLQAAGKSPVRPTRPETPQNKSTAKEDDPSCQIM